MPLIEEDVVPTQFPKPQFLTLNNWEDGVVTLVDKSLLSKKALERADNIFLYEQGQPGPRPGVDWFGEAPGKTTASFSPSSSRSPSASASFSPSASRSPSASLSPSSSRSPSSSISSSPSASRSPSSSASVSLSPSASLSPSSSRSPSSSHSPSLSISPSGSLSPSASASRSASRSRSPSSSSSPSSSYSPSASNSPSASISFSPSASLSQGDWAEIDGFDYFDFDGVIHLVAAAGGAIYRSTDDAATWTYCIGGQYLSGTPVYFNQYNSYLYITTGVNNIMRYDGSTTIVNYTSLATPVAPTVVETGSGLTSGTSYNYFYKCARVNTIGFSQASVASTVIQTGLPREEWTPGTNFATLTLPSGATNQTRWDVFVSIDDIDYYYLGSSESFSGTAGIFVDDGTALVNPAITAPADNTTQGPLVEELTNVGSRMYGVRDTQNRYRIWFSSGNSPKGAFSSAYDGGYLDWQEGGKYIPKKVVHNVDGKSIPVATVFLDSADGQGGVLQMTLDTLTVGDISITVPSAYQLPGSRGTPAPGSVVNVLRDYLFYNSQAFYNLGPRAQFLNLISTDEVSANIRPTVKQISSAGESMIASVYFDANVYQSVPLLSDVNNVTMIYNTEIKGKPWLPKAFTIGFKKFLRYTDTNGNKRLLALKPGDSRLSEISEDFYGDYGEPFVSFLSTGLYPVRKDRFEYESTEKAQLEVSQNEGVINFDLLGIDRVRGYRTIKSKILNTEGSSTLVDTWSEPWDHAWDQTSAVEGVVAESSTKRYFDVQRELQAVQWNIMTNTLRARYKLRTLQTLGTETQGGDPRNQRI